MRTRLPLVIFVCTGNTCRSPMAEVMLRAVLASQGVQWRVRSAGTNTIAGLPASPSSMAVAAELGLSLNNHRSQPLTRELVRDSDLIVALTRSHADIIVDRFPDAASVTVVLGSFVADAKHGTVDVPDPISSSLRVYRQTRDQIAASLAPLASFLAEVGKRGRADSR